jgi:hypothetical protein
MRFGSTRRGSGRHLARVKKKGRSVWQYIKCGIAASRVDVVQVQHAFAPGWQRLAGFLSGNTEVKKEGDEKQ